ncbi:hypothetical protein ANO11243_075360 [Dothideomycetidae sp. 11243]|nr:hypothetical protein ANO11243_075360 [fungal sp. No.11243]
MFRFYTKRRRQPRWVRVVFIVALVGVVYFIGINTIAPGSWAGEVSSGFKSRAQSLNAQQRGLNAHGRVSAPQIPIEDEDPPARTQKNKPRPKKEEEEEYEDHKTAAKGAEVDAEPKGEVDPALDRGLKYVFSIAPDELHVRELLRPIENSGKERLRELGLRARSFRTLLEAWEDVHLVQTKQSAQVRDDIITYLSKVKDLSGINPQKSRAEIIRSYENLRYFLTKLSALLFPWTAPYFADHMTLHASFRHGGRGIVLSGGDGQLQYMLTSVQSIRKLGCNLPIEVLYLGDEDLGDDSRSELEALPGVITRDMKQMVRDEGWDLRGWAGKPFAMLLSSFREVIFIDADAMFFVSPETLFEDPGYEETGSLFFRDRLMFPESKRKWLQQILPKPMSRKVRQSRFWTGESGHMQESGVVVVDKWRHFMALLMVTRMNGPDRDGDKDKGIVGTYDMVYGDKETFWLGWELVGDSDYVFHPGEAGNMGVASEDYNEARRRVMGIIEDAEKKKQEEEEQKKLEEKKRDEEEKKRQADINKEKQQKQLEEERKKVLEAEKEQKRKEDEEKEKKKKDDEEARKKKESERQGEEDKKKQEQQQAPSKDSLPDSNKPPPKAQAADEIEEVADEEEIPAGKLPIAPKVKRDLPEEEEEEEPVEAVEETPPTTVSSKSNTICAPQLLHLGRDGRPLWFNGWILDNKFDQDHPRLSTFESFMLERKQGAKVADWRLEENNLCCLQSDKVYSFTKKEKEALANIVAIAKEIGALGKNKKD